VAIVKILVVVVNLLGFFAVLVYWWRTVVWV
jgi:hypothetical protein